MPGRTVHTMVTMFVSFVSFIHSFISFIHSTEWISKQHTWRTFLRTPGRTVHTAVTTQHRTPLAKWYACLAGSRPNRHISIQLSSVNQATFYNVTVFHSFTEEAPAEALLIWTQCTLSSRAREVCPPSPLLDNIRVMVIVWRLRGNIIITALCWIVWQCSQSAAHLCEQFLQVQQTGFVTLGPLRCV